MVLLFELPCQKEEKKTNQTNTPPQPTHTMIVNGVFLLHSRLVLCQASYL